MKVVFTTIIGNYDDLKPISVKNPEWRYVAIVDDTGIDPVGWELMDVSVLNLPKGLSNAYRSRWAKIKAPQFFGCQTIYIDGSYEIIGDITELDRGDFCLKKHPVRNCVYEEAKACIRYRKASEKKIKKQVGEYSRMGMPADYGMYENGVFFMPFNADMVAFCNAWIAEIMKHTHRDQLSITKVLWRLNITPRVITPEAINNYLKLYKHTKR